MEAGGAVFGCEVLVAGAYFADLVFHGLPHPPVPGGEVFAEGLALVPGGAYTLAMAVHRLGRSVVWGADFGTDVFSGQVLAAARAERLDEAGFRHHAFPVRSVTAALSGPCERAMVSYQEPVPARALVPLVECHRPCVLMLPQLLGDEETVGACRAARGTGALVAMDGHDTPATLADLRVRHILAEVDVFTPNAAEALRLTGAATVDGALARLAALAPTVVVTRGAGGSVAVHGGGRYEVAALAVRAVDATAAGDCFNAGLVHGLLAGWDMPACLAAAAACAAAATTGPGSARTLHAKDLPRWLEGACPAHPTVT